MQNGKCFPKPINTMQQKLPNDRHKSTDWIESTRKKVDEAIASLEANGGSDGETIINQMLDKFRQARESQQ